MKEFIVILGIVVLSFLLAGCGSNPSHSSENEEEFINNSQTEEDENNEKIEILSFETGKATYSSYENITFFISIKSPSNKEGVTLSIKGIKPYNRAYINLKEAIELKKGLNNLSFSDKTPHCTSGCGGVYPGPYDINLNVMEGNKTISNDTLTINLIS